MSNEIVLQPRNMSMMKLQNLVLSYLALLWAPPTP